MGFVRTEDDQLYFVNGFGVGYVADANWRFNNPGRVLRFLKQRCVPLAIGYAALAQWFAGASVRLLIQEGEAQAQEEALSNFHLVKTPYISGSFKYPAQVSEADGVLACHRIKECSRGTFLAILLGLLRGRFSRGAVTQSGKAAVVRLSADAPFAVEVDGEVYRVHQAEVSLAPYRLLMAM